MAALFDFIDASVLAPNPSNNPGVDHNGLVELLNKPPLVLVRNFTSMNFYILIKVKQSHGTSQFRK